MEFNTKTDKDEILNTLIRFKKDIFDKTITDEQLACLADKFAKYAVFLVLSEAGSEVGYIAFYCNDTVRRAAFVSMIIVDSIHQGRGYGKRLLAEAIEVARASDMSSIELEVHSQNDGAIGFYNKMGFSVASKSQTKYTLVKAI